MNDWLLPTAGANADAQDYAPFRRSENRVNPERPLTTTMGCLSCNPAMTCQMRRSNRAIVTELQASKRAHLPGGPMFGSPDAHASGIRPGWTGMVCM